LRYQFSSDPLSPSSAATVAVPAFGPIAIRGAPLVNPGSPPHCIGVGAAAFEAMPISCPLKIIGASRPASIAVATIFATASRSASSIPPESLDQLLASLASSLTRTALGEIAPVTRARRLVAFQLVNDDAA